MAESFWADPNLEPKRMYRWLFYFAGIPQWLIKKVTKPSWEVTETAHEFLIHKFYYPGRVTWNEVKVTLADPVQPDSAAAMVQLLRNSGYAFPLDPNTTQTLSKVKGVNALGHVLIQQLGAEADDIIEEWTLKNAWIKNVELGELDYSSDDMVDVTLTIRYDWAEIGDKALGRSGIPSVD